MTEPLLELRGVNKSFGAVQVLHDVNFKVYPGQVTALVGDNGAGKSTLVKTTAGIYRADSGQFLFEGKPVTIHGPKDAADLGIEVVYQDLALCDNLDIVENMFLGRETRTSGILLDELEHGGARPRDARLALGAHREVGAPERRLALRRPAPDRGDRQGRAVELPRRAARRAHRRARRGPDPSGARPRPPAGRQGPRRGADLAQHGRRPRGRPTGSRRCSWAASPRTSRRARPTTARSWS